MIDTHIFKLLSQTPLVFLKAAQPLAGRQRSRENAMEQRRAGVPLLEQEGHGMGHGEGLRRPLGIPTAADSSFRLPGYCGQRRTEDKMSAVVSTVPALSHPPGSEHPLPAASGWGRPHAPLSPPSNSLPVAGSLGVNQPFPPPLHPLGCLRGGSALPHGEPVVGQGVGGLAGEPLHPLLAPRRAPFASSRRRSRPCAPSWSASPPRTTAPSSGGVRRSPRTPCRR